MRFKNKHSMATLPIEYLDASDPDFILWARDEAVFACASSGEEFEDTVELSDYLAYSFGEDCKTIEKLDELQIVVDESSSVLKLYDLIRKRYAHHIQDHSQNPIQRADNIFAWNASELSDPIFQKFAKAVVTSVDNMPCEFLAALRLSDIDTVEHIREVYTSYQSLGFIPLSKEQLNRLMPLLTSVLESNGEALIPNNPYFEINQLGVLDELTKFNLGDLMFRAYMYDQKRHLEIVDEHSRPKVLLTASNFHDIFETLSFDHLFWSEVGDRLELTGDQMRSLVSVAAEHNVKAYIAKLKNDITVYIYFPAEGIVWFINHAGEICKYSIDVSVEVSGCFAYLPEVDRQMLLDLHKLTNSVAR